MNSNLQNGKLIRWKDDRGFGFIQPNHDGQEVFLHISEIKDSTRRPKENDTIYYYVTVDANGKIRAYNAFILGARSKSTMSHSSAVDSKSRSGLSFPITEVLLLSMLPLFGAIHFTWKTRNPLFLILYPLMSLVTYVLYAKDKDAAKRNSWRISEQTLHICEFVGGWVGGFIAQRTLRHKSKKESYQAVFWAIVFIHYSVWLLWLAKSILKY